MENETTSDRNDTPTDAPGHRRALLIGLGALLFLSGLMFVVSMRGAAVAPPSGGTLVFEDTFDRAEVGDGYTQADADYGWTAGSWKIEDGRLVGEKIHNAALWLDQRLPKRVRIEFDARAHTGEGDVKCEVFGDGKTHQSGYIIIHGGWKNSTVCIARQDEHGEDRKVDNRDCGVRGGRRQCVESDVDYHWAVVRDQGDLEWYLNGSLVMRYPDTEPIQGRHFAFNNWEARVSFDNLKIYDLSQR